MEGLPDAAVLFLGLRNISWSGVIVEHANLREGQEKNYEFSSPGIYKNKVLNTALLHIKIYH